MTTLWVSGNVHNSVGQKSSQALCLDGGLSLGSARLDSGGVSGRIFRLIRLA